MRGMRMRSVVTVMALVVVLAGAAALTPRWRALSNGAYTALAAADVVSWSVQTSGIDTNLRGVSAAGSVDSDGTEHIAVWACGSNGVILVSNDFGKSWKRVHVAGGDALDFRGIVAFDAKRALVMSSGEGDKSRIYKTIDGGVSWKLGFTESCKGFFVDALACDGGCYAGGDC